MLLEKILSLFDLAPVSRVPGHHEFSGEFLDRIQGLAKLIRQIGGPEVHLREPPVHLLHLVDDRTLIDEHTHHQGDDDCVTETDLGREFHIKPYDFSLLRIVFTSRPRRRAASALLLRVCSRVFRMSCFSASSMVTSPGKTTFSEKSSSC